MKAKIINLAILIGFLAFTAYLFSHHFYLQYQETVWICSGDEPEIFCKTIDQVRHDYERFRAWVVLFAGGCCLGLFLTIGRDKKDY